KWAVVSYGEKPTMWLQPTAELDKVVEATDKVKLDTTGDENVIEAINFTMKNLGVLRKPMFVVLVTDEEGSDVKKTEAVNGALQSMISAKARLFVFGREASFQLPQVREWLRDKNGERMGPWGDAERGLESCEYEYFPPDWFWVAQRSYNGVPSGFGCWVQSMLAHQTGGTYYILSDVPSKYDDEMMEEYRPEWDPKDVYEKRTEASRVRKTMSKLFKDYPLTRPSHWITQLERLKAQTKEYTKKAQGLRKLAERAIDDLEPMKSKSRHEKYAKKRWQANYDLTFAMLHKIKFEAGEYVYVASQALRKGFPKPKKRQKFNIFAIYYDNKAIDAVTGRRGNREMEKAKELLSRVIQNYKGTPWGEVAKQELSRTHPLKMTPIFYIEPTRPKL
ncbi:MAG: hypothetical protein GXP25_23610, partial [Planctomycetes bacterium]|nr:hypothetical protein [Planctomycetota bacterium]